MNEISLISKSTFLGKEIDVYGNAENPLFKANDVAEWLELSNVSDMITRVDESLRLRIRLQPSTHIIPASTLSLITFVTE